jgi:hypothetical protein
MAQHDGQAHGTDHQREQNGAGGEKDQHVAAREEAGLFSSMGTDSAPASVTAPRMPASVVARFSGGEGRSDILPAE